MPDAVSLARTARESLALGLNALQADPRVPPHLVELAAPIAQAMGALHRIEASRGADVAPNAQAALAGVQTALSALQAQPPSHEAVVRAMEAVAGALGSIHALVRGGQPQPAAAPAPAPAAPRSQTPQPAPQAYASTQEAYAPPAPQYAPPAPPPQPQQAYAPPQAPQPQAYAPPPQQPAPAQRGRAQGGGGSFDVVAAELGAHSPSNFYKGLSGNDIVDHGGLFVSTYKLPPIGQPVRVRVSLPGGYEFEANTVVRWRREPSDSGSDAPPGFGAQFTEITAEARQLVYRYVRNREPMFHDDL
ncbi:MAG: PilZ domain-containing protein [Polyangiaceae bacterium]